MRVAPGAYLRTVFNYISDSLRLSFPLRSSQKMIACEQALAHTLSLCPASLIMYDCGPSIGIAVTTRRYRENISPGIIQTLILR